MLFNSKLFGLLYELFYETTRTHSNLRFKEIYLSEIPTFDLNILETNECKNLFSKINKLIKDKNVIENNFIKLLQAEFKNVKITNKLNTWYLLNHVEFVEELKKQKFSLKLQQKNEWILYFSEELKKILPIVEQINHTDQEIDNIVYQLYNLTPEEIQIVENAQ